MNTAKVMRTLERGVTVADLIAELKTFPSDAVVCFACNYGDYSRTEQLLPVTTADELSDTEEVCETAYSNSGLAIADSMEENGDETGDESRNVVVLRAN